MALREPIIVPDGFVLFEGGLNAGTLRDPRKLRYWRGLSADEAGLLYQWVESLGGGLEELHTDVPVGFVPDTSGMDVPSYIDRMCRANHPLRMDAVAKVSGAWLVVEVKRRAGYQALGQVLTYGYYAHLASKDLVGAGLLVVTDSVQECIRPVFGLFGVATAEVGDGVLGEV